MNDVASPVAECTYRYPANARWSYGAAALASGVLAAGAIALQFAARVDPIERGQLLIFTAVFVALAAHAAAAARLLRGGVRIARTGVGRGGRLVPWDDVARVDIQPLRQRMDVFTADGRLLLSLRPELESFAEVQEYIIAHMRPPACTPPVTIPLLSPVRGAPVAIGCALLAVWFGPQRGLLPAALFAAVSVLLALLYLARRRRIDVQRDRLVLRQGWRRFDFPYHEISAVHLQARPRAEGGAVHFIVLEREAAESVPISGFRRGYNETYHCIMAAWRGAGA